MENYVNRPLSDKSMKFGIMVVHDLTNDINYNASWIDPKFAILG